MTPKNPTLRSVFCLQDVAKFRNHIPECANEIPYKLGVVGFSLLQLGSRICNKKKWSPGDSTRALFIPKRWRSRTTPWKGSRELTIPKKVTAWITRYQFSFNFQFIKNLLGKISIWTNIFQIGLVQPPPRKSGSPCVFCSKKTHPPKNGSCGSVPFQEGGRAGIAAFGCQTTDILQLHTGCPGPSPRHRFR